MANRNEEIVRVRVQVSERDLKTLDKIIDNKALKIQKKVLAIEKSNIKEVLKDMTSTNNRLQEMKKHYKALEVASTKFRVQVDKAVGKEWQGRLKESVAGMTETNKTLQQMRVFYQKQETEAKKATKATQQHALAFSNMSSQLQKAKDDGDKFVNTMQHFSTKAGVKEEAEKINNELKGLNVTQDMTQLEMKETANRASVLKNKLSALSSEARATGKGALSLGDMMKTAAKSFSVWIGVTGLFFATLRQIKEGIKTIKDLDDALLELRKVTDLNVESMDSFVKQAQEVARAVGRTSVEVTNATADFARMGFTVKESLDLAEQALILTNIGDGIDDISEASTDLIAILKGFNFEASESQRILDSLNEVSNNYAVNTNDLADGVKRAGATLAQTGTTFEETLALLTASNEVLQNMEKSSTGLITISQRLRGVEEAFEEGEDATEFTAKLGESFKEIAGIDITDFNGNLRSTYDIFADLSKVWDTLNPQQQQFLAEQAAGKRQVNVFNSIMANSEVIFSANETALNSYGSAIEENEKYLDSISGKVAKFNEALERLWTNSINSEQIKMVVDFGTSFVNLIDKIGLLNSVLLVASSIIGAKMPLLFANFANAIMTATGASVALSGALSVLIPVAIIMAGIKIFDELTVSAEEQRAKIETLTDEVKYLGDEYKTLKEKSSLTPDEYERLNLLEKELQIKKDLLKAEKKLEAERIKSKFATEVRTRGGKSQTYFDIKEYNQLAEEIEKLKKEYDDINKSSEDRIKISKDIAEKEVELLELELEITERISEVDSAFDTLGENAPIALQEIILRWQDIVGLQKDAKQELEDYTDLYNMLAMEEDELAKRRKQKGGFYDAYLTDLDPDPDPEPEEIETLERFYKIIRQIAESEYLMDMAEGTDAEADAIKRHMALLQEHNRQMQERIDYLNQFIDTSDGATGAELEMVKERDNLIDQLRDNNIEIQSLTESYRELTDTFEENRQSVIDMLESQKSLLEGQMDGIEARQEALEKERKNQEYLLDIQEKLLAVEKARETLANVMEERNTRMLTAGGFEWVANPQDIAQAQESVADAEGNLAESRKDYREWLEDERLEAEKEALQTEIDLIEDAISKIEAIEATSYETRLGLLNSFITKYNLTTGTAGIASMMGGMIANGIGQIQPNQMQPIPQAELPSIGANGDTIDSSQTKEIIIQKLVVQAPEMATFEKIIETAELKVKTM